MKRARPIATLATPQATVHVRLGGGWDGRFAKLASLDRYRAQVSRFGEGADLTRLVYMLEALPSSQTGALVFMARSDRPVSIAWVQKVKTVAMRLSLPATVETLPVGLTVLTVANRGGSPRKDPEHYDRLLARRDARFARRREKTAKRWIKNDAQDWAYWAEQRAEYDNIEPAHMAP